MHAFHKMANAYIHTDMHAHIYIHTHTCIHTYIQTYMQEHEIPFAAQGVCVRHKHPYIHACMHEFQKMADEYCLIEEY